MASPKPRRSSRRQVLRPTPPAPAARRRAAPRDANDAGPRVRVRMYRQGLGDCFLITFAPQSPAPVHILVDCGTLGTSNTVTMAKVAQDVLATTGGHLHVLVATHEHKDHLSGFNSQKAIFDRITVDRVWMAWTEDPEDPLAKDLAKDRRDLVQSLGVALGLLGEAPPHEAGASEAREGLEQLLSFYGETIAQPDGSALGFAETVQAAMQYVASRATDRPDYLRPGRLIEPAWLPGVRFYVLGPPPSREKLRKLGTDASPELYRTAPDLSRAFGVTTQFMASGRKADAHVARLSEEERVAFERQFPFDREFRLPRTGPAHRRWMRAYEKPDAQWRRIDRDYLGTATDLALQLDNQTNNTSLVLAMEFVADGRVLLFPADAQLGNWLSWHDEAIRWSVTRDDGTTTTVTARDLLRRTVFYKVGHHSSHNATINALGLELMTSAELVAVIPVDGLVAGRKQWKMPATALYQRLLEKTSGRVVRSDTLWPTDADRPASIPVSTWTAARRTAPIEIDPGGLFVDYILR